jgi:hypothetical protein
MTFGGSDRWLTHGGVRVAMRVRQTPAIWLGSHLLRAFYSEDIRAKWVCLEKSYSYYIIYIPPQYKMYVSVYVYVYAYVYV